MAARSSFALLLAAWLGSAGAFAADSLLRGELGQWLDGEVAPPLAQALSHHPRFEGETVRLTTVTAGAAPGTSNRLAVAIEGRLRQSLLGAPGIRLAVDAPARECGPPPAIDYLVRVELTPLGQRQVRVHIAVVDVAESVWVSGISHQWQGRLATADAQALASTVSQASPGTAGSPIPVSRPDEVARAVKAELACLLPPGLEGSVYVATPDDQAMSRIGLALKSELHYEPLAVLTADRDQARWLLQLDTRSAGTDVREVSVMLAAADGSHRQQVGSVFVSGAPGAATAVADAATLPVEQRTAPPPPPRDGVLLSSLRLDEAREEGICDARRARNLSCVAVTFELLEPAYLFVVSTRDHLLVEAPCEGMPRLAQAGTRRFRLRVPPGDYAIDAADTGPDAGFYVLAARGRAVAGHVHAALSGAPGLCGRHGVAPGQWVQDLAQVLDAHGDVVEWRAIHLAHASRGIVAL